jgi:NAD(P)-dependent dehydrogenase (short-subunit alcohol dehydrogenase family)
MRFKDRVVIVTGAGRGIGRGVARAYAREGAKVVIADKDAELADETAGLIAQEGGAACVILCDVSRPDDISRMIAQTEEKFSVIDVLICNAGFAEFVSPYDLTVEDWDRVIGTNLRGTFLCSREAARVMRKKNRGSIVTIASTRALMSEPDSEAYAASKGGIAALTHALAASFAKDNIQVNCISPGWIDTGSFGVIRDVDHSQHFSNRVGVPEDVARACLYLTEQGNSFVNGVNLIVDGGMTRKMIYEP